MRRILSLLCCAAWMAAATAASAPTAGVAASSQDISESALERVRSRRVLLVHGDDHTPLAAGLRSLAKADPRYAITTASPWSAPRRGGAIIARKAETGVRADRSAEALAASAARLTSGYDVAVLDLAADILPDGRRVEAPIRFFTASMEINLTHAGMNGSAVDNIVAPQIIQGANATVVGPPANYPIELPNLGVEHLHTAVGVPAGSAADGDDWRMSPRDPRQALADVTSGLEALGRGVQPVYATIPLARARNAQRNYFNQALRAWCAAHGRPVLDVAEILSTGRDGVVASDAEGPRLAEAWSGPAGSDEASQRVARAWWSLQVQLADRANVQPALPAGR